MPPTLQDLRSAKQQLAASLLRAGLRGGVVGASAAIRVEVAVANAGRNVHAVGIGQKEEGGRPTGQLAVRVYVVQKLAESLLPPRDLIPEAVAGVPVDVIESPPAFLLAPRAKRRRPARPTAAAAAAAAPACTGQRRQRQRPFAAGISAGHVDITAGTIGYFCRSTQQGDNPDDVFVLSNNHVFADVDRGEVGDPIYQPGPADGGVAADRIADLHRWVPIALGGTTPNRVDAAIGRVDPAVPHTVEICSIGSLAGSTGPATEEMLVRKHGRTSGYTEGKVTDIAYDALVGMDHNDPSVVALFENQLRIERIDPYPHFGLGGDSGSLVVTKEGLTAVGLYFAGPQSGVYGVANPVDAVQNELRIALL